MSFSVTILRSAKLAALHHCLEQYPSEACGLLLGSIEKDWIQAELFVPITNVAQDPLHHFTMDPVSLLPYLLSGTGKVASIVGILHSHPRTAAIPSAEDLKTSWIPIPTHWIVSLLNQAAPEMQAYRYEKTKDSCAKPYSIVWSMMVDE